MKRCHIIIAWTADRWCIAIDGSGFIEEAEDDETVASTILSPAWFTIKWGWDHVVRLDKRGNIMEGSSR